MNRDLYRIVFNAVRGQLMAVAEIACSHGKTPGERRCHRADRGHLPRRSAIAVALAAAGAAGLAHSQVVAYKQAPGNQQPTVLSTSNNIPLVNIQTPSDAGVSRNTYSQFDIDSNGVVLNNSRKGAATRVAGQVGGNPWLAKGTAKVILNEVVSSNPSQVNGIVEVAGDRAEVIVANPAGVTLNGGGFINASKVTVSTGKVGLKNGAVDTYEVKQGTVTIGEQGLDVTDADYAALLARAVKINGALHAKQLKVVTGANSISADHATVNKIQGSGAAPEYALDVSQLGGMYAGKIVMVGTDAGVGVRNAGMIASAGEFTLTADGKLVNSGRIVVDSHAVVEARRGLANKGTVYAQGNLRIASEGTLENTGLIGAQGDVHLSARTETGAIVSLQGSSLIAGLTADGLTLDTGKLTLESDGRVQASGTNRAGVEVSVSASDISLWGSHTSAPFISLEVLPNSSRRNRARRVVSTDYRREDQEGALDVSGATLIADDKLVLKTEGLLRTDNASVYSENLQLTAHDLSNRGGRISQGQGDLLIGIPGMLDNTGGVLQGPRDVNVRAGNLGNDAGSIIASGSLNINIDDHIANGSGTLAGTGGTAVTAGSLQSAGFIAGPVTTRTTLDNAGVIDGSACAGSDLLNTGTIKGGALASGRLDNTGTLAAGASAQGDLANTGVILGQAKAGANLDNGGRIEGDAEAGGKLTNSQRIAGQAQAVGDIDNSGEIAKEAKAGGSLRSSGLIAGNATSGADLENDGEIAGDAQAGGKLINTRLIAGNAQAAERIDNSGEIRQKAQSQGALASGGVIVGNASAGTDLINSGDIGGDASAGKMLSNSGSINGNASAADNLSNVGNIRGSASAGRDLGNSGSIGGSASANGSLSNSGGIGGSASAGGELVNVGGIGGSASAGGSLSNSGGIGGNASAGGNLGNAGSISGSAYGGSGLNNGGSIGGDAVTPGGVTNSGTIGGSVSASDLGNTGTIGGSTNITGGLNNAGTIGGNVITPGEVVNSGSIGGSVSAHDLGNSGSIGGSVTVHDLDNTGAIGTAGNAIIEAANIRNTGTLGSEIGNTVVKGDVLDNTKGSIVGGDGLFVTVQNKVDNSGGHITSAGTLRIDNGREGDRTLDIVNTGGSITGGTGVFIEGSTLGRDGSIVSHGAFGAKLNGDYNRNIESPFYQAEGPVTLEFSGTVTNDTVWHNDGGLTVSAANIVNNGEISSNSVTQVVATDGDLTNRGLIQGKEVDISGSRLDNDGGRISGDSLTARFTEGASNVGGNIDIAGAADIRIGGDLNNDNGRIDTGSLVLNVAGNVSNRTMNNGPRAGITARSGDADINIDGNLDMQGADLKAEGDMHGFVLGDILVDSVAKPFSPGRVGLQARAGDENSLAGKLSAGGTGLSEASTLQAGGDLSLIAGGNARYQGTDIDAGGKLTLGAVTGDLDVFAKFNGQDQHLSQTVERNAIGDTVAPSLTTLTDSHRETASGGNLSAGQDIVLLAGHDINLHGIDLTATGGDIDARAGHDLRVIGMGLDSSERIETYDPNAKADEFGQLWDSSAGVTQTDTHTYAGGELSAGGNINLDAGHGNPFNALMLDDVRGARQAAGMPENAAFESRLNDATPGRLTLDGVNLNAGATPVPPIDTARPTFGGLISGLVHTVEFANSGDGTPVPRGNISLAAAGDIDIQGRTDFTTVTTEPGADSGLAILRKAQGLSDQLTDPIVTTTTDNASGRITGHHVSIKSDQGGVNLSQLDVAITGDLDLQGKGHARVDQSQIDTGGYLYADMGGNFTGTGSDFVAAGDLAIYAEGKIDIRGSSEHQEWGGKNDHHVRDTGTSAKLSGKTVTISGTGERHTDAQGNIIGSNVTLNHVDLTSTGLARITGTGNVDIDPGIAYAYDYQRQSSSSGFIVEKSKTTVHESESTTVLASTIKAGSLEIGAKGDINLTAVAMEVKGDTTIQAGGKANYWAAHNQTRTLDESTTSRSLLGHEYKSSTQHQDGGSRSALVTSIQSEGNILSDSTGDSTLQGTRLQSGGHVQLQSGASIHLQTADGQSYQTTWQERSNLIEEGGAKPVIHYHDHDETGSQSSSVDGVAIQGNSITLIAATGDIDGKAIDFHAKNGIHLQAGGHILIDTGEEHDVRWHQNQTAQTGHTTLHTGGRAHFDGVTRMGHDDLRTDSSTRVKTSTLDAGAGHLTTISGGDTVILGSDLKARDGIDLYSGGNIVLAGSAESKRHQQDISDTTQHFKGRDGTHQDDNEIGSRASRFNSEGNVSFHNETQVVLGNVEFTGNGRTFFDTPEIVNAPDRTLTSHNSTRWDKDWMYKVQGGRGDISEDFLYARMDTTGGVGRRKDTKVSFTVGTGKAGADGQAVELSDSQYRDIVKELAKQPGLGYLDDLVVNNKNIDWQSAATLKDKWDYKAEGLTPEGAAAVIVVVSYFTSGAASGAAESIVAGVTGEAVVAGTAASAASAAIAAGMVAGAGQVAVSTINNQGHLDKVAKDVTSEESLKQVLTSMVTAGLLNAPVFDAVEAGGTARSLNNLANVSSTPGIGAVGKFNWDSFGQNFAGILGRSAVSAGVSSIIQGGDFEDNFRDNVVNDLAAVGANAIGTQWGSGDNKNPFLQTVAHGVLGCAAAAARGGDCQAGAVGGMTESIIGNVVGDLPTDGNGQYSNLTRGIYTAGSMIAADMIADHFDLSTTDAMSAAQNAATNNRLLHRTEIELIKGLAPAYAAKYGISVEEAETQLTSQALRDTDKTYHDAHAQEDNRAEEFLRHNSTSFVDEEGRKMLTFASKGHYDDASMYADTRQTYAKEYAAAESGYFSQFDRNKQINEDTAGLSKLGPLAVNAAKGAGSATYEIVVAPALDLVQASYGVISTEVTGTPYELDCFSSMCSAAQQGATYEDLTFGAFDYMMRTPDRIIESYNLGSYDQAGWEAGSLVPLAGMAFEGGRATGKVVRDTRITKANNAAEAAAADAARVENNFYRDGEHYTIANSNEINARYEANGDLPPYMPDTPVIQGYAPKGRAETQVISEAQVKLIEGNEGGLGQWSTTDSIPNQSYARNELAIIPDFKADVGYTVTIETVQETPFNRGIVGPQEGAKGGGMQTEWLVPKTERGDYIVPLQETIKPLSTGISEGKSFTASFADVYTKAPQAKAEIDLLSDDIAATYNGTVAKVPIKSKERALEKIEQSYGGDATMIKDLARNTIVVEAPYLSSVAASLDQMGASVKVISPVSNELGYSGINSNVMTKSGITAEIQVNTPEMIFAKEPPEIARAIIGDELYNAIATKMDVQGGLGHKYYEEWRALPPDSAEAKAIAEKSREYYDQIRKANDD